MFCLSLALMGAMTSLRAESVTIPPEPQYPDRKNLSKEQFQLAWKQWKAEHDDWEAGLTAEQVLADGHDKSAKQHVSSEKFERERRLPLPGDGYDWKKLTGKMAPDVVTQLERDKIAYGGSVKQSFDPYIGGPVFITSDSFLNGFHVLFEDSFRELELRQASAMRGELEKLLSETRSLAKEQIIPQEAFDAALRQAQFALGPAMVLLGSSVDQFDEPLRAEILSQVEKIKKAEITELPEWLAPVDNQKLIAIDYRRCKPVGFYADSEELSTYFRTVRWLQMVPFRGGRDQEFDAIFLLGLASAKGGVGGHINRAAHLFGPPADLSMMDLCDRVLRNSGLGMERRQDGSFGYKVAKSPSLDLTQRGPRVRLARNLVEDGLYPINSDLRAKSTMNSVFTQTTYRIMPAMRTPDAELFQRMFDANSRLGGLAVAALLGSDFAATHLGAADNALVQEEKDRMTPNYSWRQRGEASYLYNDYLKALSALVQPPLAGAPEFMKSEAWAAKSCQTVLAGWAQFKHTFTLQAKTAEYYLGIVMAPPGFVEDNPEFFARMARLSETASKIFSQLGCFSPLEAQKTKMPAEDGNEAISITRSFNIKLQTRWEQLIRIAHMLETLGYKQASHQPWSPEDEAFLKSYGETMGGIMGYDGNSWENSNDDAPRWAEAGFDPTRNASLAVAIGRPRLIYILYPWQGIEVLCTGSVMQYYEYDSHQRLTDAEWKTLLDSADAPAIPGWLATHATAPDTPKVKR